MAIWGIWFNFYGDTMKSKKELIIRNSTAEFLIFTSQAKEQGIEVRYEDENSVVRKFLTTATDGKTMSPSFPFLQ